MKCQIGRCKEPNVDDIHTYFFMHIQLYLKKVSVWYEMGGFQDSFAICKNVAMPITTEMFLTTDERFQMRCCIKFYIKGHQNC